MSNHEICRIDYERTSNLASQRGVYRKVTAWRTRCGERLWYEVRDERGEMVWYGTACCKWAAKANAYQALIDAHQSLFGSAE